MIDLTYLVKKLYKQEIEKLENLMIEEDDFDPELMIKIVLYEALFQQPKSVLNKTVLALLKNIYKINKHSGDCSADDQSISDGFESLSQLERNIFDYLMHITRMNCKLYKRC